MEKKTNIRVTHLVPKGQLQSEKKQDNNASRQWPRNSRRRESNGHSGGSTRDPIRSKAPNGHQQRIDKRPPRGRGHPQPSSEPQGIGKSGDMEASGSSTGLEHDDDSVAQYELNSVFLPGSKKQNLNHLLNYHYAPRKVNSFTTSREARGKNWTGKHYSKEQFLQANCQFVVKSHGEYDIHRSCPDTLVKWDQIEQIVIHSNEDTQCPICLYPPVAGKMTRCGHVYCWACILHYLALSDKSWRKCPICYEPIYVGDLKSAVANYHHEFRTEDVITLKLMKRKKGSLTIAEASKDAIDVLPYLTQSKGAIVHSKLILANPDETLSIVEHEQLELLKQLEMDGPDGLNCPEMIFIQQALDLLSERKALLNQNISPSEEYKEIVESSVEDELTEKAVEEEGEAAAGISEDSSEQQEEVDVEDSSNYFYFYQAMDGQNLYLHTVNNRMIQAQFGELRKGPETLSGRIVQKDSFTMDETLRKRLKYLQHLPIACQFDVVEIVFDTPIVSPEVMDTFSEELKSRAKNRQVRAREERIREMKINEVYDRQMGKMMQQVADIDIGSPQGFPSMWKLHRDSSGIVCS
uniref:E3 ubiquitin-protein ligase RNF10 n=2 Tax=Lutzomyia longipalpis TaxID=7200 RepID=A0A7G3AZK6_LUTLO